MKFYIIVALAIGIFTIHQAQAHDDPEANHDGGPCWINELPITPVYCIFTKGDRLNHPYPKQPK